MDTKYQNPQTMSMIVAPQTLSLTGASRLRHRYEFTTRNQHVVLAAASKKGRIFVAAGSTAEDAFPSAGARLLAAVDTFQLII